MKRFFRPGALALVAAWSLLLAACPQEYDMFLGGAASSRRTELEELFTLINKYQGPEKAKERFIINKQIIDRYNNDEMENKKILYLTYFVGRFPEDPFNGYYLALVAQSYQRLGAAQFAAHYYEKAVTAFEDLFFAGEYVHKYCLQELAALAVRPEEKIAAYQELLRRFSAAIDVGATQYQLARAYEQAGEYEKSVAAYRAFLAAPKTTVPGVPNAYALVTEKLSLYETAPHWIRQDLNGLVAQIRTAIEGKNAADLEACRARGYFFTLTWEQKNDPSLNVFTRASLSDYIGAFLLHSNVTVNPKLDIDSSAREAYLRTENWAFRIHTTWYFYFRKVDFPADPEVNGGWEWAGIYFGEKL